MDGHLLRLRQEHLGGDADFPALRGYRARCGQRRRSRDRRAWRYPEARRLQAPKHQWRVWEPSGCCRTTWATTQAGVRMTALLDQQSSGPGTPTTRIVAVPIVSSGYLRTTKPVVGVRAAVTPDAAPPGARRAFVSNR
jgi:hypothetical protein